jgi:hypothetical protein
MTWYELTYCTLRGACARGCREAPSLPTRAQHNPRRLARNRRWRPGRHVGLADVWQESVGVVLNSRDALTKELTPYCAHSYWSCCGHYQANAHRAWRSCSESPATTAEPKPPEAPLEARTEPPATTTSAYRRPRPSHWHQDAHSGPSWLLRDRWAAPSGKDRFAPMSILTYAQRHLSPKDKPLVWLRGEVKSPPLSPATRIEAGFLLRRLQAGIKLEMPHSRPMPGIGTRCHELRIVD